MKKILCSALGANELTYAICRTGNDPHWRFFVLKITWRKSSGETSFIHCPLPTNVCFSIPLLDIFEKFTLEDGGELRTTELVF